MKALVAVLLSITLACTHAAGWAQEPPALDASSEAAEETGTVQRPDQLLYKGLVGNLLEAVPMDPEQRVGLQRGNAILSAPFSARSLAVLVGITNPVVMIGGLLWGLWAASRIEAPRARPNGQEESVTARLDLGAEAAAGE